MSWISQNYEKAAIGVGAVVALGLAFAGWNQFSGVSDEFKFDQASKKDNSVEVADADNISQAIASLGQNRVWTQAKTSKDRAVDLFTGIPLFLKKDAPGTAIDLHTDAPVHAGIPNSWWLENRLDLGFGDSPQRDPDGDGFSNAEEFASKTDPNDPASHPTLIAKLKFVRDDSLQWLLDPGMEINPGEFAIQYHDLRGSERRHNRLGSISPVKPGEIFFPDKVMANRFKFIGHETVQEENPRTSSMVERTYLNIEDQKPNKKGTIYRIPNNIPDGLKPNFYQYDRSAVLTLEAAGKEGQEFTIEENTRFGLPADSEKKDYLLKKVTPDAIEVEFTTSTGETQTLSIPKGSLPTNVQ
jgi:hypothetical protein